MEIYSEATTLSRLVTYEPDHCIKCQDVDSKLMSVVEIHDSKSLLKNIEDKKKSQVQDVALKFQVEVQNFLSTKYST